MEELQMLISKINCLLFRALMIGNTPNEIVSGFEKKEDYVEFMDTISNMLENDPEFFFLRDFIDKAQLIVSLASEKFADSKEERDIRNKHIVSLNQLKCSKDKDDIISKYLGGETSMRGYLSYTDKMLFDSMQGDYYVVARLQEAIDGNNKLSEIDSRQFLESTSFFTYMMPELYQLFPDCIELTRNEFDRISKEEPKIKMLMKPIKRNLSKLK